MERREQDLEEVAQALDLLRLQEARPTDHVVQAEAGMPMEHQQRSKTSTLRTIGRNA